MNFGKIDSNLGAEVLRTAVADPATRTLLRIDMSALAGRAGCSTTTVRRFLAGNSVGQRSMRNIFNALGMWGVTSQSDRSTEPAACVNRSDRDTPPSTHRQGRPRIAARAPEMGTPKKGSKS